MMFGCEERESCEEEKNDATRTRAGKELKEERTDWIDCWEEGSE